MTTEGKTAFLKSYEQCEAAAETTLALLAEGGMVGGTVDDEQDKVDQLALLFRLRELVQEVCETGSSLIISNLWLEKSLEIFEAGFASLYGPADEAEAALSAFFEE
jgi:hypothetical protein